MTDRVFDRRPFQDPRSRGYPIRTLVAGNPLRSYTWGIYTQLDQGSEGACVGFGWAHELAARPAIVTNVTNEVGRSIYHEAQTLDPWEGEAYEGTSVLAGAKAVQGRGFISEYRWAFTLDEILLAVGYRGPVVMGTNWYEGMFETDDNGHVELSGAIAGGHCWLVRGVSLKRGEVLCRNSWGPDWGLFGDFRLTFEQLDALRIDGGEACIPLGRDKIGDLL